MLVYGCRCISALEYGCGCLITCTDILNLFFLVVCDYYMVEDEF